MKFKFIIFLGAFLINNVTFSQVGIGTTNPDSSSMLDIKSETSGVLIPRMTNIQKLSILNPAEGLLIYQTDNLEGFYYFDGNSWISLNGISGQNGKNSIIKTTTEPIGINCENGGIKVEVGLDLNNNSLLDLSEIDNNLTKYVCNGLNDNTLLSQLASLQNQITVLQDLIITQLPSVSICNQVWSLQNLDVSQYSDGTPIPEVTDPTVWGNLTTGAWCYYNNDSSNANLYGKIYNWYAVAGIYDTNSANNPSLRKKLAPIGWHIPTLVELNQLIDCLGGQSIAGGKMKESGTLNWLSPNTNATNSSGLTALPGGYRNDGGGSNFATKTLNGWWWVSTENNTISSWSLTLNYNNGNADIYLQGKKTGFSVRCIKD